LPGESFSGLALLPCLVLLRGQASAEQLVQQLDPVRVDYIFLAIGRDLGNPSLVNELLHLFAINAACFPGEAQHPADLMAFAHRRAHRSERPIPHSLSTAPLTVSQTR